MEPDWQHAGPSDWRVLWPLGAGRRLRGSLPTLSVHRGVPSARMNDNEWL